MDDHAVPERPNQALPAGQPSETIPGLTALSRASRISRIRFNDQPARTSILLSQLWNARLTRSEAGSMP